MPERISAIPVQGNHVTLLWEPKHVNVAKALEQILDELHQEQEKSITGQVVH